MSDHIDRQNEITNEEIDYYSSVASKQGAMVEAGAEPTIIKHLAPAMAASDEAILSFPEPRDVWIDATYDGAAQYDSYTYIAPVAGKRLLQLGGSGLHAIKAIRAGAREAWLLTPVLDEADSRWRLLAAWGSIVVSTASLRWERNCRLLVAVSMRSLVAVACITCGPNARFPSALASSVREVGSRPGTRGARRSMG